KLPFRTFLLTVPSLPSLGLSSMATLRFPARPVPEHCLLGRAASSTWFSNPQLSVLEPVPFRSATTAEEALRRLALRVLESSSSFFVVARHETDSTSQHNRKTVRRLALWVVCQVPYRAVVCY